ncbi:MAG: DPP IV N-terminal domain-containing protein [Gemmatimonadales bacterium]
MAISGSDVALRPSPDGRWLVYTVAGPDQLRRYDMATHTSTALAPRGHTAAWSPDGTRIAFWNAGDIWIMNADGTGVRALTEGQRYDLGIDWSPDGRWIVARSGLVDLVDAVGGGFLRLGYTTGYLGATWKPR